MKKILSKVDERIVMPFIFFSALILAGLCLLIAFTPTTERVSAINKNVDLIEMENDYKKNISLMIREYEGYISGETLTDEKMEKVKADLLSQKVPVEFKDLHLNLVLAIIKMKNFLNTGSANDKLASERVIIDAKKNYDWLN